MPPARTMLAAPSRLALLGACLIALCAPAQAKDQPAPESRQPDRAAVRGTAPALGGGGKLDASAQTKRTDSQLSSGGGGTTATPRRSPARRSARVLASASEAGSTPQAAPAAGSSTPAGGVAVSHHHTSRRHSSHRRHSSRRHGAAVRPVRRGSPAAAHAAPPASVPAATTPPAAKAPVPSKPPVPRRRHRTPGVSVVQRTVHDIVRVIPAPVKAALVAMAALLLAALAGSAFVAQRSRRLGRQRRELLQEVGLLQAALLPEVPERLGRLAASVAYRPADGPGAGGDFYDVFEMEDGRVGVVVGDVAGHGREALARTGLLRYTLRAYLETGVEPRTALRVAGESLGHSLRASFATAVTATYDPVTGTLTYSCAGHPPPVLLGPGTRRPITVCSAPPIGVGERTGLRQTTVPLTPGSLACFFTDGVSEARRDGDLLGRVRLVELLEELGDEPSTHDLLDRIRRDGHHLPDDMAACIIRPLGPPVPAGEPAERLEELELGEGGEADLRRFLAACSVHPVEIGALVRSSAARAADYGGALVRVKIAGEHTDVSLVLPVVELLEAASRR
jgi:serine phosphatase RsbU (regulator of sigma subunit)